MTENTVEEYEQDEQAIQVQRPGELLRESREAAGLSQAFIADTLHLTVHYVNSLENDDYEKLPGLTFVKGYFRSYARYLNMDVEYVLGCYERYVHELGVREAEDEQTRHLRKRNDQVLIWAVVTGIVLVAGLALGWWLSTRGADNTQARVPQATPGMTMIATRALPGERSEAKTAAAHLLLRPQQRTPVRETGLAEGGSGRREVA